MALTSKMYGSFNGIKANLRGLSTSVTVLKSHYDALGITPKATQAEVKSAYYKKSMEFHPDRNKGSDDAAQQFRDASSAYEVLGNVKLRRLYDKGLYTDQTNEAPSEPVDPHLKFYQSREKRARPPPPDGRTPIYDFDEWSRQHYGATFAEQQRSRQKAKYMRIVNTHYAEKKRVERASYAILVFLFILMYVLTVREDYDNPMPTVKK